jgi:sulfide:quinone oxidoreductase
VRAVRVVVLGAGFGGLEVTTAVAEALGDEADVVLIDRSPAFVFGFSKLDVMFGHARAEAVRHPYHERMIPGCRFVQASVESIDPRTRHVDTTAGPFDADVLVVALGADVDPGATPGLVEGGHEFYTVEGAFALREVLEAFEGGRVVVGVTSTPFKCPPAPSEAVLLTDAFLRDRGRRDRSEVALVMPLPVPIPPSPEASRALLGSFAERGIEWHPGRAVASLDPGGRTAVLDDGSTMDYDLFLGVPRHRAPAVVVESGMTVDGWVPVDPLTLETEYPGVFALGDVTSAGTPKAGVFAEGHASVAADAIVAMARGDESSAEYDGKGTCYVEFGGGRIGRVEVAFVAGQAPVGTFEEPSLDLATDKLAFGSKRVSRWFGRTWAGAGRT